VFAVRPEVEFLTAKRIGFDSYGKRKSFGCECQRWWRDYYLDPENVLPGDMLCIMQETTYWRRSLWDKAGASLDLSYHYAADFELWARFMRHAQLYTIEATIAGFREHGEDQRSKLHMEDYRQECLKVIEREKIITTDNPELDKKPPPLITLPVKPQSETTQETRKHISRPESYVLNRDSSAQKISVVTPCYNSAKFLEECIDSVLSQGWPNLEYILIDGGSTDGSVEIIKKYEKYLSYWQSEPDEGQYYAINRGFEKSSGEIMTWLNSDDIYHPGALKRTADVFRIYPEMEWITGRPNATNEEGELMWVLFMIPKYCRYRFLDQIYWDPWIQQESVIWKRSLWEKAGARLDTNYKFAADLELWVRFFRYAQLHTVNDLIGSFRMHPDCRSRLYSKQYEREAKKVLLIERELFERGMYTKILPPAEPVLTLNRDENKILCSQFMTAQYTQNTRE